MIQARPAAANTDFKCGKEAYRLRQVWIGTDIRSPVVELEVTYPPEVLQRHDNRGYLFRLAPGWSGEGDRVNSEFDGEPGQSEAELKTHASQCLTLAVPQ